LPGPEVPLQRHEEWGGGYDEAIRLIESERLSAIVEGLIVKGYKDEDITSILGGNLVRVAREVWK